MRGEHQQGVFKKKVKCYNYQKLKHYVNDCSESDYKQQKNVKKIKMLLLFLFYFNKKNIEFPFNYKNDSKKNVSLIMIKTLIDFETIISFVFQLIIKKLKNSKNKSNEH